MQISYSIYSLTLNQKYNPNTINNTQNDKKPTSNAVLYNLETYEEQHNYFIGTLLNENIKRAIELFRNHGASEKDKNAQRYLV